QANVRAVLPDVLACGQDNNGDYTSCTAALLQSTYDQSIDTTKIQVVGTTTDFSICSKVGTWYGSKPSAAGAITAVSAAPSGCTLYQQRVAGASTVRPIGRPVAIHDQGCVSPTVGERGHPESLDRVSTARRIPTDMRCDA